MDRNASTPQTGRSAHATRLLLLFLALLVSAHFAMVIAKVAHTFLFTDIWTRLGERRPYQDRLLLAPVFAEVMGWLRQPAGAGLLRHLPPYLANAETLTYFVADLVATFAALVVLWPLARRVHGGDAGLQRLSVGLFVGLLYVFFCLNPNLAFILPYDVPAIAFTTGALLLWSRRRWIWLFALMVPATLNRETILLVPVCIAVHAVLNGRDRADLLRAGGLVAVWAAIKGALSVILAGHPTEQGLRLVYNFVTLAKPWQWPAVFILPLLFGLAVRAAWEPSPTRHFAITALIGGGLLFAAGQITETRAFGELIPYLALALAPMVRRHLAPAVA